MAAQYDPFARDAYALGVALCVLKSPSNTINYCFDFTRKDVKMSGCTEDQKAAYKAICDSLLRSERATPAEAARALEELLGVVTGVVVQAGAGGAARVRAAGSSLRPFFAGGRRADRRVTSQKVRDKEEAVQRKRVRTVGGEARLWVRGCAHG